MGNPQKMALALPLALALNLKEKILKMFLFFSIHRWMFPEK